MLYARDDCRAIFPCVGYPFVRVTEPLLRVPYRFIGRRSDMFFRPIAIQHLQRLENHVRVGGFYGNQHVRVIPDSLRGGVAVLEQIIQQLVRNVKSNKLFCFRCNRFIPGSFFDDGPGGRV